MNVKARISTRMLVVYFHHMSTLNSKYLPEEKVIDAFNASLCICFIFLQVSKPISFRIKVQQAMNLPERIVKVSNESINIG